MVPKRYEKWDYADEKLNKILEISYEFQELGADCGLRGLA
jgi:hypothetical protein